MRRWMMRVSLAAVVLATSGCGDKKPVAACCPPEEFQTLRVWKYNGPIVYIITDQLSESDGLVEVGRQLEEREINVRMLSSDRRDLKLMHESMLENRDRQFILVGHGTGGHAAYEAALWWNECEREKPIRALILVDAIDADEMDDRDLDDTGRRLAPEPKPLPCNVQFVYNLVQRNSDPLYWGYPLTSTRGSNRMIMTDVSTSQALASPMLLDADTSAATLAVDHGTIDSSPQVLATIARLCRIRAEDSYAYTPIRHRVARTGTGTPLGR